MHSPNNPGLNLRAGTLSYRDLEGLPIRELQKVKLCFRNEFVLMRTLQLYMGSNEHHPVLLGLDS